jgi:hypothetical protein
MNLLKTTHLIRCVSFILLLWLPRSVNAQLRKAYGKPVRWAATFEAGGLSPIASVNAEYAIIQSKKSFLAARGGFGQLFTGYNSVTLPHALIWNKALNKKSKGCPTQGPRNSLFVEMGVGGVYLLGSAEVTAYRWGPILGVRRYFAYNNRANGFWKVQLTPIILSGELIPWGGLGIGVLID